MEIADIDYQLSVVGVNHQGHFARDWARTQMHAALDETAQRLVAHDLTPDDAKHIAVVKYGLRGLVLNTGRKHHGQPNKDKDLERAMCLYALDNRYPGRFKNTS